MNGKNDSASGTPCCADSCCGGSRSAPDKSKRHGTEDVRDAVREGYAAIARAGSWSGAQHAGGNVTGTALAGSASGCCTPAKSGGGCCGPSGFTSDQLARALGYREDDLGVSPDGANMGLSCGNPTALASLKLGEIVLDLGSGGGFDCFIAGPRVGASGRVIGVDMTPEMLSKARGNVEMYRRTSGLNNVEFRLGEIENLPVADSSVDVVISNCVLNLSPDKPRVWREIARVLRPGGRVAVSDLALLRPLPASIVSDLEALVGCVAGAVLVEQTRADAEAAGLVEVELRQKAEYIDAMTDWQDPLYRRIVDALPPGTKPSDFITSLDISARRAG